jgi:RNA polymerase sigma factor (TIGR02999 family)
MAPRLSVTRILQEIADEGLPTDEGLARLYPFVYEELRRLARALMRDQKPGHTLTPTALVHEVYLRLVGQSTLPSESRARFFCVAAKAMRSVLVDHARRRTARKRGGSWHRVTLDDAIGATQNVDFEVLSLHQALEDLAAKDLRMARVVEMRVFAGLTIEEAANVLGVSKRTVDGDWKVARAWLSERMSRQAGP